MKAPKAGLLVYGIRVRRVDDALALDVQVSNGEGGICWTEVARESDVEVGDAFGISDIWVGDE